jgi:hypothetical protein
MKVYDNGTKLEVVLMTRNFTELDDPEQLP